MLACDTSPTETSVAKLDLVLVLVLGARLIDDERDSVPMLFAEGTAGVPPPVVTARALLSARRIRRVLNVSGDSEPEAPDPRIDSAPEVGCDSAPDSSVCWYWKRLLTDILLEAGLWLRGVPCGEQFSESKVLGERDCAVEDGPDPLPLPLPFMTNQVNPLFSFSRRKFSLSRDKTVFSNFIFSWMWSAVILRR